MPKTLGMGNEHLNSDKGVRTMPRTLGMRWLVVAAGAAMLLVLGAACTKEVEVPGETVVVEKEVVKIVEVPGETVIKEVPGETIIKEVMVPGETVTVTKEVIKEVMVPGETVVVEKVVVKEVEVPGETVTVTKEVIKEVMVPGETVVVEKEVIKTVAGPERVMVKEVRQGYVFDPATGKTWTAPEYGGTLTWAHTVSPASTDVWEVGGWAPHFVSGVNEKLSFADWGLSREKHFDLYIIVDPEMTRGNLAESWSQSDDTTFIWNIRQGVNWDNKAPVNGREFDADDVVWNYDRYFGLGDFTEDGPSHIKVGGGVEIESARAIDKWTVEIKHRPGPGVLRDMLHNTTFVYAPEVFEKYGDLSDWRNVVGTGPYRLTEVVEGSSSTWEKNPNYWAYDEKFPQNRLPYVDTLRTLEIPEKSARLAALRTGKLDMLSNTGNAFITSIDDLESIQKTNPDLEVWPRYSWITGPSIFNQALPPMQDVNVRKALQMSVDRETISNTFFKGWADPTPYGLVHQGSKGWAWPYEDWPEEVKAGYRYDPAGAEALLDAAGHPRLADGYRFTIKLAHHIRYDPTYAEIVIGYLDAIGVKAELTILTSADVLPVAHQFHLMNNAYGTLSPSSYVMRIAGYAGSDYAQANDPRMNALVAAMQTPTTLEEWQSYYQEADEIAIRGHWGLIKSNAPKFSLSQPWVEGYAGEFGMGWGERNTYMARLWIDSELKKTMGR